MTSTSATTTCGPTPCAATKPLRDDSAELEFVGPTCNLRDIDLGIAIGSAAKTAAIHSIDCRWQTRIAVAARKLLRATPAGEFFTDAPIALFPASWQDAGSGVATMAVASLALGLGLLRDQPAREVDADRPHRQRRRVPGRRLPLPLPLLIDAPTSSLCGSPPAEGRDDGGN